MSDPIANKGKNKGHENLIPIKPGESRNPTGRPKMPEHLKKLFQGPLAKLSLEVLQDVLNGTDTMAKTGDNQGR